RPLVVSQPEERGMANAAVLRPLGEAHLADEARLDPVMAAPARRAGGERRGRTRQRLEPRPHERQRLPREPGADLRALREAVALVEPEVERAEVRARALRIRPAADDELLPELHFDLEPVARAAARVGAVGLLGDDALEPALG